MATVRPIYISTTGRMTVALSGDTLDPNVMPPGSQTIATEAIVDFGSIPTKAKQFSITISGLQIGQRVECISGGYMPVGVSFDEYEFEPIVWVGRVDAPDTLTLIGTCSSAVKGQRTVQITARVLSTTSFISGSSDIAIIQADEALSAGNFVNVYNNAGSTRARKADATVVGREVDGYVLAAAASGSSAIVYFKGTNTSVSGLTPGSVYLQAAGAAGATIPSATGSIIQRLGVAISSTAINFERGTPITLG